MRVLFLYPNRVMITRIPVGIGYLAAYLKHAGHKVKVFDTTFIKCGDTKNDEELRVSSLQVLDTDLEEYGLRERETDPWMELEKEIGDFKPDIVAMTAVDPNYIFGLSLLRQLKQSHKDILTVVGGPVPTFEPEEVISEDCVDIICIGEGEEAMLELCNRLEVGEDITHVKNLWVKQNGNLYKNNPRSLLDINTILLPDWDIFDQRHLIRPLGGRMYRMGLFYMTRGCLFGCKYCANLALAKLKSPNSEYYRIKNPQLLIEEIVEYKTKYNLNFVFFIDDLFPLQKKEIIDDFVYLYRKRIRLPFTINLHPELIKEEQLAQIVDAGCRNICVGLESGSPGIRKEILGRGYTNEQVINVFRLARKYGIRSSSFNMIGIPSETRKNIFETVELNRQARPTTTTLTFFHPYRGTTLRRFCIANNLYDPTREHEYENVYREESCLTLPQISRRELNGIFKTFQLYFKLPKIFYCFIRIAEGESFLAKTLHSFLKNIFYKINAKEEKWDFTAESNHG